LVESEENDAFAKEWGNSGDLKWESVRYYAMSIWILSAEVPDQG
jgi:hypothetical protein